MFHNDYLRLKKRKDKLLKKIEEREKRINQDVSIRDIIVQSDFPSRSFGEVIGEEGLIESLPNHLRPRTPKLISKVDSVISAPKRLLPASLFSSVPSPTRERKGDNLYQQYDQLSRLVDHIDALASVTNEYHQQYYWTKTQTDVYPS